MILSPEYYFIIISIILYGRIRYIINMEELVMERSRAQKILGWLGNIDFVLGVLLLLFMFTIVIFMNMTAQNEFIAKELEIAGDSLYFNLAKMFVNGVLLIVEWKVLRDVSKDETKYRPAWLTTMVLLAFNMFNFITSFGKGVTRNLPSAIIAVVVGLISLYLINGIRLHAIGENKQ